MEDWPTPATTKTKRKGEKRILGKLISVILVSVFVAFALKPSPAQAGFFSFLGNLFSGQKDELTEVVQNSQTISLLRATLNSENKANTGGGDITIVNGNSLMPDTGPLGTMADIEENTPANGQISIYVVREGDNLSQIAEMFNVSANTIVWTNNIKRGDIITVGQTLVILPISGVQYTVKNGDTLEKIAKKYKGDIKEIIEYNGLAANPVPKEGDIIIIPDGFDPDATPSQAGRAYTRGIGGPSYAGYYIKPVDGLRSQGLHGYNAVDLASYCGAPVVASASGDVVIGRGYGWNGGYGNYVVIQHPNGTQTLYAHLAKNIVSMGWHVAKGQVVGYEGSTGKSTGCHVHFEIRGARNPF